jgi:acylphosphatase
VPSPPTSAYRYLVSGRVQGVGYRYFALRSAESLGVCGFVRNLSDGRVEVVGEASEEALAQFEGSLRQGPSFSSVSSVDRTPIEPRGDRGFQVR